jgi:uncharacterized protein (DUF2336 family)
MSEPAPLPFGPAPAPARGSRARSALFKRMADVVCLPSSRVNAFERSMIADLLTDMLKDAVTPERARVARRLSSLVEIPHSLVRLLLRDNIDVARPLLEDCASLGDPDLIDCARHGGLEHRRLIAARRGLSELVSEAVAEPLEPLVVELLLRNDQARISADAVDRLAAATRETPRLIPLLLRRSELRPSHAYVMFWWADAEARRTILQRFAVSREVLQEAAADVYPLAAEEGWQEPLSRKALQFIERRQRNRSALQRSPFESLEAAISVAEQGLTREIAQEIAYLSGLKPMTGAKILSDAGGEPIAILCKATGLSKASVRSLWRALRRPETGEDDAIDANLERVLVVYDMIAVDRAQTVLRYWNWSLSSAMSPDLLRAIREGDEGGLEGYSIPERAAMLSLSGDFSR